MHVFNRIGFRGSTSGGVAFQRSVKVSHFFFPIVDPTKLNAKSEKDSIQWSSSLTFSHTFHTVSNGRLPKLPPGAQQLDGYVASDVKQATKDKVFGGLVL